MQDIDAQIQEIEALALSHTMPLVTIVDDESFRLAVEHRGEIKRRRARIAELMAPICLAAHSAWKMAVAKREELDAPFAAADKAYAHAMGTYEQEQRRLQREVEERARQERERLEAEERHRVLVEQRRLRLEEEDRRLAEAIRAEGAGDTEAAERLLELPVEVPEIAPRPVFVPRPPVELPRMTGVAFRDNWSAEVIDMKALVRAVAAEQQSLTLLKPDMTALNGMARALKGAMRVPGVRAIKERIAAQRQA